MSFNFLVNSRQCVLEVKDAEGDLMGDVVLSNHNQCFNSLVVFNYSEGHQGKTIWLTNDDLKTLRANIDIILSDSR